MRIKEWIWKNFGSFGNNEQKIEFLPDKGELILLKGPNGMGKTNSLKALDFGLYGECLNQKGKRLAQKLIPNRTNGDLYTNVKFYSNGYDAEITRTLNGSLKTVLKENGQAYSKANKIDKRIEEIIGFDFTTFKSFMSLNVAIFKDFIDLSPEDKRMILDKLFNLQMINELNKVLKQLKSQNDSNYQLINKEVSVYEEQIEELTQTIKSASEKIKIDNDEKIKNAQDELKDNKEKFINIEMLKNKLDYKLTSLIEAFNNLTTKRNDISRDVREIQKQIDLFNQGKCPTCQTDLSVKLDIKTDLEIRLNQTNEILNTVDAEISNAKTNIKEVTDSYNDTNDKYNELVGYLTGVKNKIKSLKQEQTENEEEDGGQMVLFKQNLTKTKEKLKTKQDTFINAQKLKLVYDTLTPIWGENGIKREIIEEIVGPINQYIQEDLSVLGSQFNVELDNNFDAKILEWGTEIDPDTLSTGEAKRINLVIMMAYIKMIRLKKDVNILILDELFASIDIEGVDFILQLMKKYANERCINIIIVHHSDLNKALFDRIIEVKKTHYSYIEDTRIIN